MSECKVYRREFEGAADGRPVSAGARAHAALCRACGDSLRGRESLRALVGGLGKVEAPADFEFRLRARMAAAKSDGGRGRFSGTRWLYGFAPVAVAACFVIVSATLYFRQAARPAPSNPPAVAHEPARNAEPDRATSVNVRGLPAESPAAVGDVAGLKPAGAVPQRIHKPARRANARAAQAGEVASVRERRTDVAAPGTLVSSVTAAQVITRIPLKASDEPLRVILRDERGAERVVPMRSVSFGSQDFLARGAAGRPSAAPEVGGVW